MTVTALVPMRAHSERVSGKNTRFFAGAPLYHHVVKTLLEVAEVEAVYIDTDSSEILEGAPRLSSRVHVIERPEALRAGTVPMNDVLLHDLSVLEGDVFVQTHATNPLLRASTVTRAIRAFESGDCDSVFTVTARRTRLYWPDGRPINHDPNVLIRTQDLPPVYEENSNLYVFSREVLERRKNRIGDRPHLLEMDAAEAWDIDDELDFSIAEHIALSRSAS